jgi:hypothetical protein
MLTGRKLALTLAFTVLVVVAFGVSCKGFFPHPVLQSIAIQPPSPQIPYQQTMDLQAWGTYDTGRSQITSGVVWSSSNGNVTFADSSKGAAYGAILGTATITASAQGLSQTASATVVLGSIANFQVCTGTFSNPGTCSSSLTWTPDVTSSTVNQSFIAQGTSGGTTYDLTTASTWTVAPTPGAGSITCTNSGASPETCTVTQGTTASPPTYVITVTYGTNNSATVNITVTG